MLFWNLYYLCVLYKNKAEVKRRILQPFSGKVLTCLSMWKQCLSIFWRSQKVNVALEKNGKVWGKTKVLQLWKIFIIFLKFQGSIIIRLKDLWCVGRYTAPWTVTSLASSFSFSLFRQKERTGWWPFFVFPGKNSFQPKKHPFNFFQHITYFFTQFIVHLISQSFHLRNHKSSSMLCKENRESRN